MAPLDNLSDDEIRAKLAELGHPVGPITETTRKILLKKLGQLIKEKRIARRSTFSPSSAEESEADEHGGLGRKRRTTIGTPASLLSRRKPTSPKNNSFNSPVNSDFLTPPVPKATRRRDSTRGRTRLSAYDFDSGSDSDFSLSSAPSSTRIIYDNRTSLKTKPLIPTSLPNSRKDASKPLLSNITRRLARWGNELNPQDIKETDVDETPSLNSTTSFVYRRTPSLARTLYERQPAFEGGWKTQLTQKGPMLLLSLFLLFFAWLVGTYWLRVYQHRPLLNGKHNNFYPLCSDSNTALCIPVDDLPLATDLYKDVHQVLLSRAIQSICGPFPTDSSQIRPYMTEREIVQYLLSSRRSDVSRIESGVRNLGLLLMANPHWGIVVLRDNIPFSPTSTCNLPNDIKAVPSDLDGPNDLLYLAPCPKLSWGCRIKTFLLELAYYAGALLFVAGIIYSIYAAVRYQIRKTKEEEEQVIRLVERILTEVTENCAKNQQEFVAIRHVHDSLFAPALRPRMANIWEKAVQFIENNESRIRREVQTVWGEETEVWRPLIQSNLSTNSCPPTPENHLYPDLSAAVQKESQRVWQGEAFETSDGSINALPVSPTPCLKIRHMFQPNKDYGADWEVAVKDAIIEKCEGVGIVHVVVDSQSKEGCVYLKCVSSTHAGLAFRRLHGSWFDGALVTVKYLRLERYHERFPDSINCKIVLEPSNNLRLSMGGKA